jgi:hypothetical protein
MSGFSTNRSAGTSPEPSFLIFWSAAVAGRQSATAAVATNTSARSALNLHGRQHVARRAHVDPRHAARRGQMHRPGHQRDLGARLSRRGQWQNPSCRWKGW